MKSNIEYKSNIFGSRLKAARILCGIPQDKLGVSIGLDEHTASARISRYESGVHEPAIKTASRLAHALHVPLAYLYCDEDHLAKFLLLFPKINSSQREDFNNLLSAWERSVQQY